MQVFEQKKLVTDADYLNHWLKYNIPYGRIKEVKNGIISACFGPGRSKSGTIILGNWRTGKTIIPYACKVIMNQYAEQYFGNHIFNLAPTEVPGEGVSAGDSLEPQTQVDHD